MKSPSLSEEKKLWKKGFKKVACLDEAGRGPLAGPVVAAAVFIKNPEAIARLNNLRKIVKDSKQLSTQKRQKAYRLITENKFLEWGIGIVSERMIDRINIRNASELAMARAVEQLRHKPDFLIVDGNHLKNHQLKTINHKLIVKADEKVFSCAAASILAKVTRDGLMKKYHDKFPHYGFLFHKGYPTKRHYRMLKRYGPCIIHRKSFRLLEP